MMIEKWDDERNIFKKYKYINLFIKKKKWHVKIESAKKWSERERVRKRLEIHLRKRKGRHCSRRKPDFFCVCDSKNKRAKRVKSLLNESVFLQRTYFSFPWDIQSIVI